MARLGLEVDLGRKGRKKRIRVGSDQRKKNRIRTEIDRAKEKRREEEEEEGEKRGSCLAYLR